MHRAGLKKQKKAFSMLELVFVIVILGILSKFGVEFLAQAYKGFIFSNINIRLQDQSAVAVEFIATRLQHRIKDSVIARKAAANGYGDFRSVASASGSDYTILEWVGADVDGYRGDSLPNWSGVADVDTDIGFTNRITSPETNTTAINKLVDILSYKNSGIGNTALYFIGSDTDINSYGWGTGSITDQNSTIHPVKESAFSNQFAPDTGLIDFSGVDVYEYYKLAWSAYAVVHTKGNPDVTDGTLTLYYDFQPWEGETYIDGKSAIIMEHVSTFQFVGLGSLIKIQVCTKSMLTNEEYSICKEKTIY